jgi:hypothetical protein
MIKIVTAAAVLLVAPVGAIAAPFCLALPTGTPQCIYYDGASCAKDAGRQNGACIPNQAEVHVRPSRIGEYCLVMPSGYSTCGYADGNLCAKDAIEQKGACSRSEGALPQQLPNDYAPNAGR